MNIYLDEAGNSGCLTKKGKITSCDNQPLYVLAAVMPGKLESDVLYRYRTFKEKHGYASVELKGNSLLTRRNNSLLKDFVKEFIAECPVYLCVYSKNFYLATALMHSAFGLGAASLIPREFYFEASNLALFGRKALEAYARYSESPSEEAAEVFANDLLSDGVLPKEGPLRAYLEIMAREELLSKAFDMGQSAGDYEKPSYQNLLNLSAFGELIDLIKLDKKLNNDDMKLIHDHILEFENEYISAMRSADIDLHLIFKDSSDSLGIQLADNMASIVFGAVKRVIAAFEAKALWEAENEWVLRLWSALFSGIGSDRFKLVVPLQEQAVLFTVSELFGEEYPDGYRNAFVFNNRYRDWLNCVYGDQLNLVAKYDVFESMKLLKR